jgi:hypothetical protein
MAMINESPRYVLSPERFASGMRAIEQAKAEMALTWQDETKPWYKRLDALNNLILTHVPIYDKVAAYFVDDGTPVPPMPYVPSPTYAIYDPKKPGYSPWVSRVE